MEGLKQGRDIIRALSQRDFLSWLLYQGAEGEAGDQWEGWARSPGSGNGGGVIREELIRRWVWGF